MTIFAEERLSDSPYIETVIQGHTLSAGTTIRPAECHWHMVFVNENGRAHPIVVGPLTASGIASWGAGAEILWIKFKLGTFMPHMPTKNLMNIETTLPGGAFDSFWLNSSTWQFPDYENADTFVNRLVRDEVLVHDPIVNTAFQDERPEMASRTIRHRFLRSTGLSQSHIRQWERAHRAVALLEQGVSILDTVFEAGYFDQPHLTRSLKQFIGYTPSQVIRMSQPNCHSIQDANPLLDYHEDVLAKIG